MHRFLINGCGMSASIIMINNKNEYIDFDDEILDAYSTSDLTHFVVYIVENLTFLNFT